MVKEKRWGLVVCCGGVKTPEVTRIKRKRQNKCVD
jgi:hypothetical protein